MTTKLSHSIRNNEAVGLVIGSEGTATYVHTHQEVLFRELDASELFKVSMGLDSSCLGSCLNPDLLHKQVLIRNVCTKVHDICKELTQMFPIVVEIYHLMGTRNMADMNSKIPTSYNPIDLINSEEWHHGLPEFLEPNFPPMDRVFLRFIGGAVDFTGSP